MGGQYVTAASKVMIVGWLLCEAVVEGSVDPPHRWVFTMIVTLLPTLGFFRSCWSSWMLPFRGGVHEMGGFVCSAYCGGTLSVGFCFLGFFGAC